MRENLTHFLLAKLFVRRRSELAFILERETVFVSGVQNGANCFSSYKGKSFLFRKRLFAYGVIIGFLFAFAFNSIAQDAKADFKKLNATFFELKNMEISFRHELFFDALPQPAEAEQGIYKRFEGGYYLKQAGREVLLDKRYTLIVDHEERSVLLDKPNAGVSVLNPLRVNMDSLFRFYESVKFYKTGSTQQWHAYAFVLKNGPFERIDVVFDPLTWLVKEIVQVYREKMPDERDALRKTTLKIVFDSPVKRNSRPEELMISHYVQDTPKGIAPVKAYSKYKLLTNLKTL